MFSKEDMHLRMVTKRPDYNLVRSFEPAERAPVLCDYLPAFAAAYDLVFAAIRAVDLDCTDLVHDAGVA